MAKPQYSNKPMSEKELARRGGFNSVQEFRVHRHGHQTFSVETDRQKERRAENERNRQEARRRTDVDLN